MQRSAGNADHTEYSCIFRQSTVFVLYFYFSFTFSLPMKTVENSQNMNM